MWRPKRPGHSAAKFTSDSRVDSKDRYKAHGLGQEEAWSLDELKSVNLGDTGAQRARVRLQSWVRGMMDRYGRAANTIIS